MTQQVARVDDRYYRIEIVLALQVVVGPKLRRHRARIHEARRLDDNVVERLSPLQDVLEHLLQLAAQRAADAAVAELEDLLKHLTARSIDYQALDADFYTERNSGALAERESTEKSSDRTTLTKLVVNNGNLLVRRRPQYVIDERRFASAQKAGQNRNGRLTARVFS